MGKKIRSARGEQVDFDLLKIKEQISSAAPPQDVKMRQDFIEKRLRRRLKKVAPPAPKIDTKDTKAEAPKLAGTEELSEEPLQIDTAEAPADSVEKKAPAPRTRRTRKPVAKKTEE